MKNQHKNSMKQFKQIFAINKSFTTLKEGDTVLKYPEKKSAI